MKVASTRLAPMDPPDSCLAAAAAAPDPTLGGLPTEVLITVANFLGIKGGEMKRLADAVGPVVPAKSFRFAYLDANLGYLKYLHDLLAERSDKARCRAVSAGLRQWMEVNHRWRDCLDVYGEGEGVHGVLYDAVITAREGTELPSSMPWSHKVIYEELHVGDDEDETDTLAKSSGRHKLLEETRSGHTAITHRDNSLFHVQCSSRDRFSEEEDTSSIIVGAKSANHIDLVSLPLHTLSFVALQKDGTRKKVRLMNYYFAHFFLNASLAVDLGLADVLECLVEVKHVSPNSSSSVGIHHFAGTRFQPLILSALVHEDSSAFKYLLSRPRFEVKPDCMLHALHCLRQLKSCWRGSIPLPSRSELVRRVRTLLRRGGEGLDMDSVNSSKHTHGTPLYELLFSSPNRMEENFSYDDVDVALVNLYLSFGATATYFTFHRIPDKTEHQQTVKKLLEAATQDERDVIMGGYEANESEHQYYL